MPKDIDESLIEATIRRVAEAQAARADGVDAGAEEEAALGEAAPGEAAPDMDAEPGEDSSPEDVASDEDAARAPRALWPRNVADESVIEATIRRVAAAKAASEAQAGEDEPVSENGAGAKRIVVDENHIEATIRRVAKAKAASEEQTSAAQVEHDDAVAPQQHALSDEWMQAVERIETRLAQVEEVVLTLTQRVDALEPLPEDQPAALRPATQPSAYRGHLAAADDEDEDEWEEQPQAARMTVGLPPRPAIFRDSVPAAAIAEIDDEELSDEPEELPPAPKPAPAPAKRRGLDLLPRTYRITVEDKRRGVDLVPLHRVLLALEGVRDMSLLSYNNGIAIVSLEMVTEIDLDLLQQAVSRAMARDAQVELHNENTIVIKLAEE